MDKQPDVRVSGAAVTPSGPWKAKRRYERTALNVPVLVSLGEGKFISGRTMDISEGGLGATLRMLCPAEQVVELQFTIGEPALPLHIRSVVKYSSEVRHGFEFLKLTSEQRKAIAQLVASKSKRPAPAEAPAPVSGPYKFGGRHAPTCVCPVCQQAGGAHSRDCLCEACGMYAGEHSSDCRCPICRTPAGKHAPECHCPRCGVAG